jgi:hypothetical protein
MSVFLENKDLFQKFKYARLIRKVQGNKEGLELNRAHQLLVCADNDKLLGKDTNIIKKNTTALLNASKEVGIEVNTEKTKCMFIFHHQTTGQNHYIKVANKSFENVEKLKYLGLTLINQNCVHEEIKSRLIWGMLDTMQFVTFCFLFCYQKM